MEREIYKEIIDIEKETEKARSVMNSSLCNISTRKSYVNIIKTERERNKIIEEEEKNEDNEKKIEILKKLNNFISNYLNEYINENMKIKEEDRKDNFKVFTKNINEIKERLKVKKIRVSFIGNISVGKSSILNCIIGDKILPIEITQCTYRGIIIKYKDEEDFKLYKTKLHEENSISYYYFIDEKTPICKGKKMIKSFLNNKNKDIDITDEDAFLVITGRLKFFEAFEENDKLLNLKDIIEFIDLPGHNNSNNEFIKRGYYNKILRYTNCCIYVNIPSSIDDDDVQKVFEEQLKSDKDKIHKNIRNQIIDSSVFVINKSDTLDNSS